MFPKWFDDWNRKNPKDIYGPAILVGAVGGAVFVAAFLVTWGQPLATDSMQTGPRGTGMSVPEFKADLATPDPSIELILAWANGLRRIAPWSMPGSLTSST